MAISSPILSFENFTPPIEESKKLMNNILNAGFLKENMLHILCNSITETHLELLKELLKDNLHMSHIYEDTTILTRLIDRYYRYLREQNEKSIEDVFKKMLCILMENGADPYDPDPYTREDSIQYAKKVLGKKAIPVLNILQSNIYPAIQRDNEYIDWYCSADRGAEMWERMMTGSVLDNYL